MSSPSTGTPASVGTIPRVWRSQSHTFHISSTNSLNSLSSEWEPELNCDSAFNGPSFTVSHTYSCPEVPCFPRTYYHSRSTSATSSSHVPTPPSFPGNRPQTPPSPRCTSSLAEPSPLCLGPSLSHIEGENVCLDKPCEERDINDNELPEFVTPVPFPIDDPTYTSNPQCFNSQPTLEMRSPNLLSYSTSQTRHDIVEDHELGSGSTRPRAMTLPAGGSVSHPDSHDDNANDGTTVSHHTIHRKKSMFDLRHEFRRRSSTHGGT